MWISSFRLVIEGSSIEARPLDVPIHGHATRWCCNVTMQSEVVASGGGRTQGYALIAALILLVLASLAVTLAVHRASTDARRERETELLFVGDQYRWAIHGYASAPGVPAQYPEKLEDLLEDRRLPVPRRYLRRIYPDPMTGKADWRFELSQGRIVGVHSSSTAAPLRHAGFAPGDEGFADARDYTQWRFLATQVSPPEQAATQVPNTSGPGPEQPPANPQPPPDPNAAARTQCFAQYGAPMLRCRAKPLPMGTDVQSCVQAIGALLRECLAPIGGL